MENYIANNIRPTLQDLLNRKSQRDRKPFTLYQLAKLIDMPHSILIKLAHEDSSKRVNNPRIETLSKVVKFFIEDGFSVSLDDFLSPNIITKKVTTNNIPLFSISTGLTNKLGVVETKLMQQASYENLIALVSEESIEPIFKKGSIFIVDRNKNPKNDNLVAVTLGQDKKILIKKLSSKGRKKILYSFNSEKSIELTPLDHHKIIGVVIQVNAKT